MGLDMYLSAKRSIWGAEGTDGAKLRRSIAGVLAEVDGMDAELLTSLSDFNAGIGSEVELSVAYWRKANAVHGWFVAHVQRDEDNCQEYYAPREKLTQLKELCVEITKLVGELGGVDATVEALNDPARSEATAYLESLITTIAPTEGFFFGSDRVDSWYFEDLKYTAEMLEKALQLPEKWSFYYQSSW